MVNVSNPNSKFHYNLKRQPMNSEILNLNSTISPNFFHYKLVYYLIFIFLTCVTRHMLETFYTTIS